MSNYLLITGGAIFCILGLLHGVFTAADMRRPRWLAPMDPDVVAQMASTGLRLPGGRMNMWDAWLGFNFSHSLGVVIFGLISIAAGVMRFPKMALAALVVIAAIYLALAVRFWYRVPAIGIAIASICLLLAWLLY